MILESGAAFFAELAELAEVNTMNQAGTWEVRRIGSGKDRAADSPKLNV